MATMSVREVQLSDTERRTLEDKCRNQQNWNDFGYWQGKGSQPNCHQTGNISNKLDHTFTFPTDKSSFKWNAEWEKAIRIGGHLATAAVTAGVTLVTSGLATGIAVGTLAAIVKDELQAKIPYPKVARGWRYQMIMENELKWSPHPWGQNTFTQVITFYITDFTGKRTQYAKTKLKYDLSELPENTARMIASCPSRTTIKPYS